MAIRNAKIDRISLTRFPSKDNWPAMYVADAVFVAQHDLDSPDGIPKEFKLSCRITVNSDDEPVLSVEKRATDELRSVLLSLAEATKTQSA
jgi:hypothetical protein